MTTPKPLFTYKTQCNICTGIGSYDYEFDDVQGTKTINCPNSTIKRVKIFRIEKQGIR